MRHKKSFNHLGRKAAHRNAMLSNMATSLIMHKRISTTVAKAKALKSYVEPLITKSKVDSTHSRRVVFSYLQSKESVSELFRDVAVKVANRPGGYTRILKTGNRQGDNAEMCIIELVDYNENYTQAKSGAKKKSTRRRRGGSNKKVTENVGAENVVTKSEATDTENVTTENAEAPKVETKKAETKDETTKDETTKTVEAKTKKAEPKESENKE